MLDLEQGLLGWATAPLLRLDAMAPGLVRRVLTVSPMRRQAIFAVLAEQPFSSDPIGENEEAGQALARVLLRERAREILHHAFGNVPDGWLGALERIGVKPFASASSYTRLRGAFAKGAPPHLAEALGNVGEIDARCLTVLGALDPRWVHATTLKRIETGQDARDFNGCLTFVQAVNSKASNEVIINAISRLPAESDLPSMVQRFIRRADRFPASPVEATDELRPLDNVRLMVEAGHRYRNCLPSKIEGVLIGQAAYAEFRREAVLEFHPLTGGFGWLLADVHVARNAFVPVDLRAAAVRACTDLGIPAVDQRCDGLRRYTRFTQWSGLFA